MRKTPEDVFKIEPVALSILTANHEVRVAKESGQAEARAAAESVAPEYRGLFRQKADEGIGSGQGPAHKKLRICRAIFVDSTHEPRLAKVGLVLG